MPLGAKWSTARRRNVLQFSHLTTLAAQSVAGPGAETQPYLYDQSDLLGDDWLQIDHHFNKGMLSFKYDLGTESLTTQLRAGSSHRRRRSGRAADRPRTARSDSDVEPDQLDSADRRRAAGSDHSALANAALGRAAL